MMNYFNRIPNELVFIIFNKLNISDLNRLRIVSKRFKAISEKSLTDLILTDDYESSVHWYESRDLKNSSKVDQVFQTDYPAIRKIFKIEHSLRRLSLEYLEFNLSDLNCFTLLEHLEIYCKLDQSEVINLPKLRLLSIYLSNYSNAWRNGFKLKFACKTLESINFRNRFKSIEILHPEMVKRLRLETSNRDYEQFENIEHLTLTYNSKLDKEILRKLKKLNVLELNISYKNKELIDAVSYVLKQRKVLRRIDLVLRLKGVDIMQQSKVDDFDSLTEDEFQIKNYDHLNGYLFDFQSINSEYYDMLVNHFADHFPPPNLFNKFFQVCSVSFSFLQDDDQERCVLFLRNLICLKTLNVMNCHFDQTFYDALADYKYLDRLEIMMWDEEACNCCGICDMINLDSITELKELRYIHSEMLFEDQFEVAFKAFKNIKYLQNFKFKADDIFYEIMRSSSDSNAFDVRGTKFEILDDGDENEVEYFCAYNLHANELKAVSKFKFSFRSLDDFSF